MTTQTEANASPKDAALKLALEALERIDEAMPFPVAKLAQKAIKEALAQPAQQDPVSFLDWYDNAHWGNEDFKDGCWRAWDAALAQRKPLDMTEIVSLTYDIDEDTPATMAELFRFARAIEAVHGIKE